MSYAIAVQLKNLQKKGCKKFVWTVIIIVLYPQGGPGWRLLHYYTTRVDLDSDYYGIRPPGWTWLVIIMVLDHQGGPGWRLLWY